MALSSTVVWEVQTGGSDTNGGGYKSDAGTTDYSTQAAAQLSLTDCATADTTTTTLTSAVGGFTAAMVGNIINLSAGTNLTTGWYEITAYADTNTVTLDRTPSDGVGAVSAATGNLGGAFATYGQLGNAINSTSVSGMKGFIKYDAAPYDITSNSYNVSGGAVNIVSTSHDIRISGYDTARTIGNNDTNRPTIQLNGGTPVTCFESSNTLDTSTQYLGGVIFDLNGSNVTGSTVVLGAGVNYTETTRYRVKVLAGTAVVYGFYLSPCVECEVIGCGSSGFRSGQHYMCYAQDCVDGFDTCNGEGCIAYSCTSGFRDGTLGSSRWVNCTSHSNTNNGFNADNYDGQMFINCVATNNGGYGFDGQASATMMQMYNCATGDNSSGSSRYAKLDINHVNLPAGGTYWTDAANGDFRPGVDGGLLHQSGSYPPPSANNATIDIGAVQHADPASTTQYLPINRSNSLIGR